MCTADASSPLFCSHNNTNLHNLGKRWLLTHFCLFFRTAAPPTQRGRRGKGEREHAMNMSSPELTTRGDFPRKLFCCLELLSNCYFPPPPPVRILFQRPGKLRFDTCVRRGGEVHGLASSLEGGRQAGGNAVISLLLSSKISRKRGREGTCLSLFAWITHTPTTTHAR